MQKSIHDALDKFEYPEFFSSTVICCGTFAEFYCKLYLQYIYPSAKLVYGNGSQKGWDIHATFLDGTTKRYQVKSLSTFAKTRTIARPKSGFDVLLVVALDAGFNATVAYMFEGESVIKLLVGSGRLTVPDREVSTRKGAVIFRSAVDISDKFFEALSEVL